MEVICVLCPKGCLLDVNVSDGVLAVYGQGCPNGEKFASEEWYHPVRILCTTLKTDSRLFQRISVRTTLGIPKDALMTVMDALKDVIVKLPVQCGDIVVRNILGLGADVVVTQTVKGE